MIIQVTVIREYVGVKMGETPCETFCVWMQDLEFFWRIFNPYTNVQILSNSLSEDILPIYIEAQAIHTCNSDVWNLISPGYSSVIPVAFIIVDSRETRRSFTHTWISHLYSHLVNVSDV